MARAASSLPEDEAEPSSGEQSPLSLEQDAVSPHRAALGLAPQQGSLAEPAWLEAARPSPFSDARAGVVRVAAVAAVASPARSLASPTIRASSRAWLLQAFPSPVARAHGGFTIIHDVEAVASPMRGKATLRQLRARPPLEAIGLAPTDGEAPSSRSRTFSNHETRWGFHPYQIHPQAVTRPPSGRAVLRAPPMMWAYPEIL